MCVVVRERAPGATAVGRFGSPFRKSCRSKNLRFIFSHNPSRDAVARRFHFVFRLEIRGTAKSQRMVDL